MDKSLKEKAIDIKGKAYVQVADRILYFNEKYKDGSIRTKLLSEPTAETIIIRASIYPDNNNLEWIYTGHAQEVIGEGFINKTSAMENAETSAVGRALAMMGIGVIDGIASIDEINKATNRAKAPAPPKITLMEKMATSIKESKDKDALGKVIAWLGDNTKSFKEAELEELQSLIDEKKDGLTS